jgi:CHAD domain-containing protein
VAPLGGAVAVLGLGAAVALTIARRERHETTAGEPKQPERASAGREQAAPTAAAAALPALAARPPGAQLTQSPGPSGAAPALSGLQRAALGQLELAIELLENPAGRPDFEVVHETRKALKRLRALVRLLDVQLGAKRSSRASGALRDAGRRLAGARDAEVMVGTLDALVERHPKRLARSGATARLRELLAAERKRVAGGEANARELVLRDLRRLHTRILRWKLQDDDPRAAQLGLERLYRQGRRRGRVAERHGSTQAMHAWRKRVKDLRYVAETLAEQAAPSPSPSPSLRRVARDADRLGELLGTEHDLALLAEQVKRAQHVFDGERATHEDLLRLIARRRRRLRREALKLGKRLFRRAPQKFARRAYPFTPTK